MSTDDATRLRMVIRNGKLVMTCQRADGTYDYDDLPAEPSRSAPRCTHAWVFRADDVRGAEHCDQCGGMYFPDRRR